MISKLENKIINADCMEILRQLPDKCIDLVLTDPPYGIGADKGVGRSLKKSDNIIKKEWDKYIPCNEVFQEIQRVSRSQIIWGGELLSVFMASKLPRLYRLGQNEWRPEFCRL